MAANGALRCTSFEFAPIFGQSLLLRAPDTARLLWKTIQRNSLADKVIREADFEPSQLGRNHINEQ